MCVCVCVCVCVCEGPFQFLNWKEYSKRRLLYDNNVRVPRKGCYYESEWEKITAGKQVEDTVYHRCCVQGDCTDWAKVLRVISWLRTWTVPRAHTKDLRRLDSYQRVHLSQYWLQRCGCHTAALCAAWWGLSTGPFQQLIIFNLIIFNHLMSKFERIP
jgi:hypothetical protein